MSDLGASACAVAEQVQAGVCHRMCKCVSAVLVLDLHCGIGGIRTTGRRRLGTQSEGKRRPGSQSQGHGNCACWGKRENLAKRAARVQGSPATAVPSVVLITALRYVLTDWLETAGYLQQRGRMHELGSSFERRVAE